MPELDFEPTLDAPATDTRAPAATRTRIPTQTATRTATRTATHPPATSTRRPPAPITGSLPPATIVPLCGFDTQFVYGDEVPDEQRALISEAAETGVNSDCVLTGVGADFGVYAFNDLNELLQIYSQLTHSPLQLVRQEWRGGGQPAITGPGGIYLNLPRISQNRRMLVQVITHEYFHVVQAKLTGPHFEEPGVPELGVRWLIEGAAEYVSALGTEKAGLGSFESAKANHERTAIYSLYPLNGLEDTGIFDDPFGYDVAFMAVDYLMPPDQSRAAEIQSLLAYWTEMGKGKSWQDAFETAFGKRVDQFYAEFETYRNNGFVR